MTTALDVIKRAIQLNGVFAIGEEPSADEAQRGLDALNGLLESLSTESMLIYARSKDAISWGAGITSKTVGPSGDVTTTRPIKVLEDTYVTYDGVDYPMSIINLQQYNDEVPIKSIQGIPGNLYVQYGMPNVTVYLWPVPQQSVTLNLWSDKLLTSFASLTDSVSFPPGYRRMLEYMLAVEIGPDFQVEAPPSVQRIAMASRKKLKRVNAEIPQMDMPYGVPGHPSYIPIQLL